ncbi:MAG: hydroxymethylbilane synthase [Alphaproteobacteria bacterium]|jgi:hydroxymethylbilane synthase|nr:hydroxymethylbilane synthase [Alphaproteobacteria bacterium]
MAQSSANSPILRLGSRGSPLALVQAREVRDRLATAHGLEAERIEIMVIRTSGDAIQDRPLADAGGKGLFTKEIEEALLAGGIDLAVHSAKDVPAYLPPGLVLSAYLLREDPRDVLVSVKAKTLADLPPGAVMGTASPRRQALVRRARPDIKVVPFRGNVETRLRKLDDGVVDATVLALAGLKRLGLTGVNITVLGIDEFLPAAGQGAIVIETRDNDARTRALFAEINHTETATALAAERAFLAVLDGTCRSPIAAHATITAGEVRFRGMILKPDGSEAFECTRTGEPNAAAELGADAGRELQSRAGPGFFT